jgi:PAS domain S-box-containing protein
MCGDSTVKVPVPGPDSRAGRRTKELLDLFRRTSDAMIAIDAFSRIVAWNEAATALLGYTPQEVLGQRCTDVLGWRDRHGNMVCGPDCRISRQAVIDNPGREPAGDTLEVLATTKAGRAVWLSASSLLLPREHHRTCRIVHFAREVSFTPAEEAAVRFSHHSQGELLLRSLTAREREVLDVLTEGATNAEIAAKLSIAHSTVQNHVSHILAKLKVRKRLEAVALALRAR